MTIVDQILCLYMARICVFAGPFEWLSAKLKEMAENQGITTRRMHVLCVNERMESTGKIGGGSANPVDEELFADKRVKTGEYRN